MAEAIRDTDEAVHAQHRTIKIAQGIARGLRVNYFNCFCLLVGIRAVELYRHSKDRKEEIARNRASQRTATRRRASPPTRAPRKPEEWDGSPQIPASNAEELSLHHATEWLALMTTGFAVIERRPDDMQLFSRLLGALALRLYIKPRSLEQARDNLRQMIRRSRARKASPAYYRFHELSPHPNTSLNELSAIIFMHWKQSVQAERMRSVRQKPKLIRV